MKIEGSTIHKNPNATIDEKCNKYLNSGRYRFTDLQLNNNPILPLFPTY